MRKLFAALVVSLPAFSAHALDRLTDGVSLETGKGSHDVDEWRVGAQWWQKQPKWLADTMWQIYWDATFGTWESDTGSLQDLGLTPTFRYGHEHGAYVDLGIGFHVLSETRISSNTEFSTKFQFGDHLGVGYRFEHLDLSLRLQHLSNAGIRNPNPGINFLQLRFQYWF